MVSLYPRVLRWSAVEFSGDRGEAGLAVVVEVGGAPGEVLTQQSVGVLVGEGAPGGRSALLLSGGLRVLTKIERRVAVDTAQRT